MAIARPQAGGASTGLKIALIVFVVLTVASLTFAIILYTDQADLTAQAESAKQQASAARQSESEARSTLRGIARSVLGEELDDPAAISEGIERIKQTVLNDPSVASANMPENLVLAGVLDEVFRMFQDELEKNRELGAELAQAKSDLEAKIAELEQKDQSFAEKVAEMESKYTQMRDEQTRFQEEKNQRIADLEAQHERELEQRVAERDQERDRREAAEKLLAQERERASKLLTQLAGTRIGGEIGSLLQIKDGQVVRTFAREELVYIDIGKADGLRPGTTFSIYDKTKGIPADGKGKATIEVVDVGELTAECKVVSKTPGDPILEGDIVASAVFDRHRKFNFVVAGGFDLDFDGRIEDPAGKEVERLIRAWGGRLKSDVDTETDFVVLGIAPQVPANFIPDEASAAERERMAAIEKHREAYEKVLTQAKSLSIPTLRRTQFLHMVGYAVPDSAEDDSGTMALTP